MFCFHSCSSNYNIHREIISLLRVKLVSVHIKYRNFTTVQVTLSSPFVLPYILHLSILPPLVPNYQAFILFHLPSLSQEITFSSCLLCIISSYLTLYSMCIYIYIFIHECHVARVSQGRLLSDVIREVTGN